MKRTASGVGSMQGAGTTDTAEPSAEPGAAPGAQGPRRRPYHRPEVVKRRSLSQATLVSGGGTGGSLAGGMI